MPDLVVPALGESITEAVISRWHKKLGEQVEADEPVVALETDKITVDLPAPASGALTEQKFAEGATVHVGDVVGTIAAGAEAAAAAPRAAPAPPPAAPAPAPPPAAPAPAVARPAPSVSPPPPEQTAPRAGSDNGDPRSGAAGRRLSPSMRRAQRAESTSPEAPSDR